MAGPPPTNFAMVRTPSCSLPKKNTAELHSLTTNFLKSRRAQQHIQDALGPKWAKNCLSNLAHIGKLPTVTDLGQAFENLPLIIVGAGPSLSKNIDQLKAARGKAIIVCAARALRSLQAAGVYPDFAISLDATDVRSHFRDTDIAEIPCVLASASSHPSLFPLTGTCLMSFSSNTQAEAWMFDPQDALVEMPTGGSVSCSAFSIALHWGCDPIILIGHDLAFPGGAVYHADGADGATTVVQAQGQWRMTATSAERKATLAGSGTENFDMMDIEAYNGGTVMTSTSFNNFRLTLEKMAVDWAGDVKLINATEGGAKIKGWRQAPLREVLASLADIDLNVDARLAAQNTNLIQAERGARINARMQTLCAQLQDVVSLSQRCLRQIDQCIRKPNPKAMAKLEKTEAAFKAASKGIAPLTLATQTDLTLIINRTQEVSDLKSALSLSRSLYALIGDAAKRLLGAAPPECVR